MFRRPQYIALVFVVAVVVLLYKLPSETVTRTKFALGTLFLPLFGLAGSSNTLKDESAHLITSKKDLLRQNRSLQQENSELRMTLERQDELTRENDRLRAALQWRQRNQGNFKLARVIGRDPANWWRTIHIDLGSQDGLFPHLPVRTAEGLVGRVLAVDAHRSQVVLLGDPNLRVGALVVETRETGVIIPSNTRQFNQNLVDLGYLAGNSGIKPNHTVVTSGDGGMFPKGILIGKIVDARHVDFGISTEARIQLAADLTSLEMVWVLMP